MPVGPRDFVPGTVGPEAPEEARLPAERFDPFVRTLGQLAEMGMLPPGFAGGQAQKSVFDAQSAPGSTVFQATPENPLFPGGAMSSAFDALAQVDRISSTFRYDRSQGGVDPGEVTQFLPRDETEPGGFIGLLQWLGVFNYAIAGWANAWIDVFQGEKSFGLFSDEDTINPYYEAWKGLTKQEIETFEDVFKNLGWDAGEGTKSATARWWVGLAADIVIDPLNLLSIGPKGVALLGRSGRFWSRLPVAFSKAGKLKPLEALARVSDSVFEVARTGKLSGTNRQIFGAVGEHSRDLADHLASIESRVRESTASAVREAAGGLESGVLDQVVRTSQELTDASMATQVRAAFREDAHVVVGRLLGTRTRAELEEIARRADGNIGTFFHLLGEGPFGSEIIRGLMQMDDIPWNVQEIIEYMTTGSSKLFDPGGLKLHVPFTHFEAALARSAMADRVSLGINAGLAKVIKSSGKAFDTLLPADKDIARKLARGTITLPFKVLASGARLVKDGANATLRLLGIDRNKDLMFKEINRQTQAELHIADVRARTVAEALVTHGEGRELLPKDVQDEMFTFLMDEQDRAVEHLRSGNAFLDAERAVVQEEIRTVEHLRVLDDYLEEHKLGETLSPSDTSVLKQRIVSLGYSEEMAEIAVERAEAANALFRSLYDVMAAEGLDVPFLARYMPTQYKGFGRARDIRLRPKEGLEKASTKDVFTKRRLLTREDASSLGLELVDSLPVLITERLFAAERARIERRMLERVFHLYGMSEHQMGDVLTHMYGPRDDMKRMLLSIIRKNKEEQAVFREAFTPDHAASLAAFAKLLKSGNIDGAKELFFFGREAVEKGGREVAEELPPLVGVIPESGVPEFGQEAFMDMLREGAAEAVHKGRQSVDAAMAKMTADLRDVAARRPKQMPVLNSLLEGGDLASGLVPDAEDLPLAIHALTLEVRSARNLHSEVKRGASFVQHLLGKERGVRKLVRVTKEAGLDAARLRVLEASYEDAARRRLMYWLSRVTKESHPGATVHVVRRKSWNDARYAFELRKKADKILQERGLIRYMESIGIVHGVETSKKGSTSVVRKLGDELRTWLRDNVKFPAAKEGARKPMLFERLYGAYASFLPISLAENMSFQAPRFVASRATKEFFEGVAHSTKLHGLELADRKGELDFLSRKYGVPFASPGEFDAYLFSRFGTHPALHRARVDWLVEHGDPGGRFAQSFGNLSEQARAEIIERAARIRGEMEDAGVHVPEGLRHLEEVWAATNPIHIQDSKSALRVIERVAKEFAEGDERLEAEIIALLKNEPNHRPDIHYSVNDGIAGAVMSGYIDDVNESFSTVVNALKRSEPRVAAASKRSALVRKKLGTVYPSGAQPLLFNSTMGAVLSDATERVEQVVRRIVRDAGIEASVPERVVADFVGDVRRLISSPTATDVSDVSLELTRTVVKFWDEVKVAVRDSDSSVVLATSLMDTQRALVDAVIRARGPRQVIAELRQRFQDILSHPDKLARLEPEQADELISAVENLRTEFEEWDQALRDSISFARRQPIGQLEAELLGLQNVAKDDPVLAGVYEMQALVRESSRGAGRETTFAMLEGMKRELLAATERDAAQAAVTDKKLLGALDTLHDLDDVGSTLAMAKENVLRPSLRVLEEAGLLEPGVDMSILSTSPRLMRAAIGVEIVDRFLTHGEISRKAWSRTVLEVVDDLAGRAAKAGVPMDLEYQRNLIGVLRDFFTIEGVPALERPFRGAAPMSKLEWLIANSHAGKWRMELFKGRLPAEEYIFRLAGITNEHWAEVWGGHPPVSRQAILDRIYEMRGEFLRTFREDNAWFHEFASSVGLRGPSGAGDANDVWRAVARDAASMRAVKKAFLEAVYRAEDFPRRVMSEFLDTFEGGAVPPTELLVKLFDEDGFPLPELPGRMIQWVMANTPVRPGEVVTAEAVERAWSVAVDKVEHSLSGFKVYGRISKEMSEKWEGILGRLPYTPEELAVQRVSPYVTVITSIEDLRSPLADGARSNILGRRHAEALIEFLQAMDPLLNIRDLAGGPVRDVSQLVGRAEEAFRGLDPASISRFHTLAEVLVLSRREGVRPRLTNLVGLDGYVQKLHRRLGEDRAGLDAVLEHAQKRALLRAKEVTESSWFARALEANHVSRIEMEVASEAFRPSLLGVAKGRAERLADKSIPEIDALSEGWGSFLGLMTAKLEHDMLLDLMKRLPSRADVRLMALMSLPAKEELGEEALRATRLGASESRGLREYAAEGALLARGFGDAIGPGDIHQATRATARDMNAALRLGRFSAMPSSAEALEALGVDIAANATPEAFLESLGELGFNVSKEDAGKGIPVHLRRYGQEVSVKEDVAIRDVHEWLMLAHMRVGSPAMFMPATEVQVAAVRRILNTLAPTDVAQQQWILYTLTSTMDPTQLRAMEAAYVIENMQDYVFAHRFAESGRPVGAEGLGLRPEVEAETSAVLGRLPSDVSERVLSAQNAVSTDAGLEALEEMRVVKAPFVFNLRDIYGRVINPEGQGVRLPKWVSRMFEEDVMKPQLLNNAGLRWILAHFIDPVTNLYKELQTVIHPSFVARNVVDTGVRTFFGMGARMFSTRRLRQAWNLVHGKGGSTTIEGLGDIPNEALYEMMERHGLMVDFRDILGEAGHSMPNAADLPEDYFNYLSENWAWKKLRGARDGIGHISGDIDNVGRVLLFLDAMDNGMAPSMASQWAQKFMFDYAHGLTPFERQVMRRVFPFYTFARFNIPLAFETMFKYPGPVSALGKTQHMLSNDTPAWEEALPPYIREAWHVVVARDGNTLKVLNGRNMLSLEDLGFLGSLDWVSGGFAEGTMEELIGRMSPFIKIWPEFVAGRNFYMKKDILEDQTIRRALPQVPLLNDWLEARPVKIGDNIYTRVNGFRWHLLQQTHLSRIYRSLSHLLGPGEDTAFERMLPFITGLRLTSVDLERRYARLVQVSNMYRGRIRLALEQGDIEQAQRLAYSGERPPQRQQQVVDTIRRLQELQAEGLQNAFR